MQAENLQLSNNQGASRYEATLDGKTAVADYSYSGDGALMFTHTEVPEELQGQGVARRLVEYALADAKSRELKVVPFCNVFTNYIRRHPEYLELVPPDKRPLFNL